MKLNLEIIGDHLPQTYHPRLEGKTNKALTLGRPRIYEPGTALEAGKLYVTRVQSLPKTPSVTGSAFICDGSHISKEWEVSGNQFLLLSNCPGSQQLFNMVQEIYDTFDAFDNAIICELAKGWDFDIGLIIKYGSEMLGNPLSVTDCDLNIVLNTEVYCENDLTKFNAVHTRGLQSLEGYSLAKDACLLERELRRPYISSVKHNGNRLYCYNLYYMDVFIGCAWFAEELRKFRNSDFQLADYIFKYLQHACVTYPNSITPSALIGKNALCSLLEHSEVSTETYEQFQLLPEESWIFFRLKDLEGRKPMPKDYMLASLYTLMKSVVCPAIFNHDIIGLLRVKKDGAVSNEGTFNLLKAILQRMDYVCGMSNAFQDIAELDNAYLEAGFSLELLLQKNDAKIICFFHDCLLEYMLSRVNGELPLSELYSEKLLRLCEYDRSHGSEYVKTLHIFLNTEMNATQSAKLLYIHRSSFLKRLEKIKELLGDELENPQMRMYYRIIFSAWEAGYGDVTLDDFKLCQESKSGHKLESMSKRRISSENTPFHASLL